MPDQLIRALHRPLNVRLVAALTTSVCQTAGQRHKASAAATCALGRGLTAGLLLGTLTKGGERVTVQVVGNGPLRGITVDAYDDGKVRGSPLEPGAAAERSMAKRQRLADLVGRQGVVNVLRDINLKDRYQGQVSLVTSEIDEDLEAYLRDSEQIPSALGCEVVMDEAGAVLAAGGVLAQIMPDSPEGTVSVLREAQHLLRTGELYDLLASGRADPLSIAQLILGPELGPQVEVLDTRPLEFRCRCDRGRIDAMVAGLDMRDLDEMIEEGKAEVICNFCGEVYRLTRDELVALRQAKANHLATTGPN